MKLKKLVSENEEHLSLGRLIFWILTITLFYFWVGKQSYLYIYGITEENLKLAKEMFTLPNGLLSTWITSLGYNTGTKIINKMAQKNTIK